MERAKKRLGDILVEAGKITESQLKDALEFQKKSSKKLGEVLNEMGLITEREIIDVLSMQLSIKHVNLDDIFIDPEVARKIPIEVAKKHNLIPVMEENENIIVATSDPLNFYALDDVEFITGKKVIPWITNKKSVDKAIDRYFNKQTTVQAIEDLKKEYSINIEDKIDQSVLDDIQNAPAVRLTNAILNGAVQAMASDIHLEPFEKNVTVRYRIDGVLTESMKIPLNLYTAISTRIKIVAGMNIAEKRVPQDGRIEMNAGDKKYDFRVSSLPTVFGEKIVIRILDHSAFCFDRRKLGFTEEENKLMDLLMRIPNGIVLLTGPTGSGKTTTLYAMLNELNTPEKNIVTIEDPVEYMLEGINQVQVNTKAGLTFASGLRSILRQDPDIIMVGEIRDEETAQIAIRAAITGHLVLSTLHTNDAPGAITRLIDMGIPRYLAAEAISGVIAQRLVRRLCPACREQYLSSESDMHILKLDKPVLLYKAKGCSLCLNTGYKGRVAIHEVMLLDAEHRNAISTGKNTDELRKIAEKKGMTTLFDNCRNLVLSGETTVSEMVKTVYARD